MDSCIVVQGHKIKICYNYDEYFEDDDDDFDGYTWFEEEENVYFLKNDLISPAYDRMIIPWWYPGASYGMKISNWYTPEIFYIKEINNIINCSTIISTIPKEIIDIIIEYAIHFDGPPFSWIKIFQFEYNYIICIR